jgi:hypothetical protein
MQSLDQSVKVSYAVLSDSELLLFKKQGRRDRFAGGVFLFVSQNSTSELEPSGKSTQTRKKRKV